MSSPPASTAPTCSFQSIVTMLGMTAHPEGGYFVETFRDEQSAHFPAAAKSRSTSTTSKAEIAEPERLRSVSTAILFLVPKGEVSHLHRLASSEVDHARCSCVILP